jgi:hypothetical protein
MLKRLCTLYTLPLGDIIVAHDLKYHIYADDTQLYCTFNPKETHSLEDALRRLSNCIRDIKRWMLINKLQLNQDKTEFFVAGSTFTIKQYPTVQLILDDGEVIRASPVIRNLGVLFDQTMTLSPHVTNLARATTWQLRNIGRIWKYIDMDCCKYMIQTLIHSKLDYGNALLVSSHAKDIQRLQRLQNYAARLVCSVRKYDRISPHLLALHWLPVMQRTQYKVMLYTYKCLNGQAPDFMCDMLDIYRPGRKLRSSLDLTRLFEPRFKLATANRGFYIASPKLWNTLPRKIREISDIQVFKTELKTFLFKLAYNV